MPFTPPERDATFLADWRRVEPLAQAEYITSELQRLAAAGAPVLWHVLTADLEVKQAMALKLLGEQGALVLPGHRWFLRLVDGARPHDRDPQGRPVPEGKRGYVEVVKVGTKGGQLAAAHTLPGAVTAPFTGPNVQAAAARNLDIYVCREIGRDPVELSFHDASVIMQRYGWGVPLKRYWGKRPPSEKDPLGSDGWDSWIVEEVAPATADDLLLDKRQREREAAKAAKKPAA